MKQYIKSILAIGLTLSVACACNKQSSDIPAPAQKITVSATLPDAATRVAAADREGAQGLSWVWEEGDAINLIGATSSVLSINEGFTAKKATFSGKPATGDVFSIVYPGSKNLPDLEALSFAEQAQKSASSKDHLQYYAALQGLKSISSFEFSPAWASANGAEFKQGGVIKIVATMPAGTAKVNRVTIKASAPVFHSGNGEGMTDALSVAIEDGTLPSDMALTAWLMTSWFDDAIPAGTALQLVAAAGDDNWLCDLTLSEAKTIKAGFVNTISIAADKWYNTGRYSGGAGTEASPWIITKPEQMLFIKEDLVADDIRYFKLGADIDMSEISGWEPLNYASPYTKKIDFNGDGHTISNFKCDWSSYPSFFGVLYGKCYNVSFTNAVIDCSNNSGCGILGGYCGTGDLVGEADHVHVQGKVTLSGNKTGVGGMFGLIGNGVLNACSADCDVYSGKNYVGGLFGYSKKAIVQNCWTSGSVRGDQRVGGIGGGLNGDGDSIINCFSTAKLDGTEDFAATRSVGGIVAHANQDKGDQNETRMPGNVVKGCIAWQDAIKTRTYLGAELGGNDWYSAGAIVAFGSTHNTYADCYRKADLDFRDYADPFLLYDQENTSPDSPLVVKPVEGNTHNYPYHGKAAAAGATISQLAQSLGWSAEVWDFSGDIPKLK